MLRNVLVRILPKRFVGTTIGLFGAALCLGKIVYCGLLEWICNNNLATFFFVISTLFGVFLTLYYPLLYPAARQVENQDTKERNGEDSQESPTEGCPETESLDESYQDTESQTKRRLIQNSEQNIPFKDMFISRFFQMTFWSTVVFSSSVYTVLYNITSITNSIGIDESFSIVSTMSLCIMTTRVVYGILFDKGGSQAFAFWLLFSIYFSFVFGLTLGLWYLNTTTVYIIAVLCGIALGPANGLPASMLVSKYGRSNLNVVFVALYFTIATSQLVLQVMTGYIYDSHVKIGNTCRGTDCFYWFFFSLLCLTILILILQCLNYMMTVHKWSKM